MQIKIHIMYEMDCIFGRTGLGPVATKFGKVIICFETRG
jgi:hypothetical protein